MKKVITLMAIMCFTAIATLKAQNDVPSSWLNPQFKQGNILQNFNKPLNTHVPEIRSANQLGPLTPIFDSTYFWLWDANKQTWNYAAKATDVVYNSNNLVTSSEHEDWSEGVWGNKLQTYFTYNSNNLITTEITQSWSGIEWVNYAQTINTYNSGNLETSSLLQIWDGNNWVNSLQQTLTYNSNNLVTSDVKQKWNGSYWEEYSQSIITYNTFNDMINNLYQTWNGGEWVNTSQTINIYNTYDNLVNSLSQAWNGNAWVNYSQTTSFTYNADNEITSFAAQTWNGNSWITKGLINNTYDANNINLSYVIKNFDSYGAFTSGDSVNYYFNKTVSQSASELNGNSTIKLYPNPASNLIHAVITLKQTSHLQLRLINIQGQTVWSADAGSVAYYQSDISVANLPDGVYLFEMINGNNTESQKVVVTH